MHLLISTLAHRTAAIAALTHLLRTVSGDNPRTVSGDNPPDALMLAGLVATALAGTTHRPSGTDTCTEDLAAEVERLRSLAAVHEHHELHLAAAQQRALADAIDDLIPLLAPARQAEIERLNDPHGSPPTTSHDDERSAQDAPVSVAGCGCLAV